MRGHIRVRKRTNSAGRVVTRYYPIVYLGRDPDTGEKRYDEREGYERRRDAEFVLNQRLNSMTNGSYVAMPSLSLSEYVSQYWLATAKADLKETTFRGYHWMLTRYLLPLLGDKRLRDLTTPDVNSALARLASGDLPVDPKRTRRESGTTVARSPSKRQRPRVNRPLSPKTVRNAAALLQKVLNDAVADGVLSRNVAASARKPKVRAAEMAAWSASEAHRFLAFVRGDADYALWHLALMTGMRRGELLGLQWRDIDLDRAIASVRRSLVLVGPSETALTSPKNGRSRVVDLDEDTCGVLRAHRAGLARRRLAFGPGYSTSDLVFPSGDGRPRHPDSVSRRFGRVRDAALLAEVVDHRITLHGLRHTHATIALEAGVNVKIVSERLGHSSPAFTMAIYQHLLPTMQRDAASSIARAIQAARPEASSRQPHGAG